MTSGKREEFGAIANRAAHSNGYHAVAERDPRDDPVANPSPEEAPPMSRHAFVRTPIPRPRGEHARGRPAHRAQAEFLAASQEVSPRAVVRAAGVLLVCALLAVACEKDRWEAGESVRAPDEDVAAALGDTSHQDDSDLTRADIPTIQYPRSLRPCCAFGHDLKVEVGRVALPGVEIGNILGPEQIGPHRYDNGFLSLEIEDPRGFVDDENNGLVYTCRGGFVDTAHVRDNADNTLALADATARLLDTGGTIEVPPQGAAMRVRLSALPEDAIDRLGRLRLSVELGRWLAYQFSIWHEIATWYGYASMEEWPEKISAFSPEDLYSNQLGARISGAIILSHGARSDSEYNLNVDAWIAQMLKRLEVVSLEDAIAAAQSVDGAWWDSERRIPDWKLVKRRRMDTGPLLGPWLLEAAEPGAKGKVEPIAACADAGPPLVLRVEEGWNGLAFRDLATVEFEVGDPMVAAGIPLPRAPDRVVTQDDFPAIIEAVRRENAAVFGEGAHQP